MSEIVNKFKLAWDRKQAYQNLKESAESKLCFASQGGLWRSDREFIAFLSVFQDADEIVVSDASGVPRKVNPNILLEEATSRYTEVMNDWLKKWEDIKKIRTAKDAYL